MSYSDVDGSDNNFEGSLLEDDDKGVSLAVTAPHMMAPCQKYIKSEP